MISIEECNQIISDLNPFHLKENVALEQSMGRVLAHAAIADTEQPPFNKSAMDGYACKRVDLVNPLKVVGVIAAGTKIDKALQNGECYRIFTGAPVPDGADCVIMQEDTTIDSQEKVIFTTSQTKNNICYQGEDSKTGDIVIKAGDKIEPQHMAILASYGIINPQVFKKISVSLFCSGSELIEPHEKPAGPMIRNSNGSQLIGQLVRTGAEVSYKGIVADNLELVCQRIESTVGSSNVIIITGGASVGDFDFIPELLKRLGAEIKISALNIQPGKPLLYATINNTHILGLSGNPVSSFLQFKLVAGPIILRLSGAIEYLPKSIQIPISSDITRKKGKRQLYTPVKIATSGIAEPLPFNGSANIGALAEANGFAVMKPGVNLIQAYELATVILI